MKVLFYLFLYILNNKWKPDKTERGRIHCCSVLCIPRCDERFVCIAIIALPPHPLLCQTNDFLPFCAHVCTGRCAPRKHGERKSRSASLTSALAGPLMRVRSNLHTGVLYSDGLARCHPPPALCEWYSPFKKGACHFSVLCVLSTVSCREHISQGQCWLSNTRTRTHTSTHTHTHTCTHTHAVMLRYRTLRHTNAHPTRAPRS